MANKGIDLDSFEIGNVEPATEGAKETPKAGAVPTAQPKHKGVDTVFDKYKKMVFLFDVSGSMGDGMLPDEIDNMYFWSDDLLQKYLNALWKNLDSEFIIHHVASWATPTDEYVEKALNELLKEFFMKQVLFDVMSQGDDEDDVDDVDEEQLEKLAQDRLDSLSEEDKTNMKFILTYGFEPVIGNDLKYFIIRKKLDVKYRIQLPKAPGYQVKSMAKIDVMKKAATTFVSERFEKNPDAQVLAYMFDHRMRLLTDTINKESLLRAVEEMTPEGGTDIHQAVRIALQEFKRAPSAVGSHQIVLVTDAESSDGEAVEAMFPEMKKLGVVLDFIQIKTGVNPYDDYKQSVGGDNRNAEALKRLCKSTGGDYVEVNTPSDFTQKFLAAANRLCLPPKRS